MPTRQKFDRSLLRRRLREFPQLRAEIDTFVLILNDGRGEVAALERPDHLDPPASDSAAARLWAFGTPTWVYDARKMPQLAGDLVGLARNARTVTFDAKAHSQHLAVHRDLLQLATACLVANGSISTYPTLEKHLKDESQTNPRDPMDWRLPPIASPYDTVRQYFDRGVDEERIARISAICLAITLFHWPFGLQYRCLAQCELESCGRWFFVEHDFKQRYDKIACGRKRRELDARRNDPSKAYQHRVLHPRRHP